MAGWSAGLFLTHLSPGRDGIANTQAPGVVATGQCDVPRIPERARRLPGWIHQLSPSEYRNPDELPMAVCWWSAPGREGFSLQRKSGDQAASLPSRPAPYAVASPLPAAARFTSIQSPTRARSAPSTCSAPDRRPRKNATKFVPTSSRRWAGSASPRPTMSRRNWTTSDGDRGEWRRGSVRGILPIDQAEYSATIIKIRDGTVDCVLQNHFFGETTPYKKSGC
jgi:hypothetical protein